MIRTEIEPADIARLRRIVGDEEVPAGIENDEHERFRVYRSVGQIVASAGDSGTERWLFALIAQDADRTMAEAAAVSYLDAGVAAAGGGWPGVLEFAERCRPLVQELPVASRRLSEWQLIAEIEAGRRQPADAVLEGSDWFQRQLASGRSRFALDLLSSSGRSKRVRAAASDALRRLDR